MATVELYVYDLSKGIVKSVSQTVLDATIHGIWHSGVVVYGTEYFYGRDESSPAISGIRKCNPGGITAFGQIIKVHQLGVTNIPEENVFEFLEDLGITTFREDAKSNTKIRF